MNQLTIWPPPGKPELNFTDQHLNNFEQVIHLFYHYNELLIYHFLREAVACVECSLETETKANLKISILSQEHHLYNHEYLNIIRNELYKWTEIEFNVIVVDNLQARSLAQIEHDLLDQIKQDFLAETEFKEFIEYLPNAEVKQIIKLKEKKDL